MSYKHISVLLIEDNAGDVLLIRKMLDDARGTGVPLALECARRLTEGLERLAEGGIDLVLLDLGLPDSAGLDTLKKARARSAEVPIIVLTGRDDEVLGVNAVWAGAQDYLIKGQVDGPLLVRAVRYALGRHRSQAAARSQSFFDDLTGLYNRRGFLTLADQHLKLAQRRKKRVLLMLARLDGLSRIIDIFGRQRGDRAVIEAAQILRQTFRESDIVARIGNDEFSVLAIDAAEDGGTAAVGRFLENLKEHKAQSESKSDLSLNVGFATSDPEATASVEELLTKASEAL